MVSGRQQSREQRGPVVARSGRATEERPITPWVGGSTGSQPGWAQGERRPLQLASPLASAALQGLPAPGVGPNPHQLAREGIKTTASALPWMASLQRSFGTHDVSDVRAHTGGEAGRAAAALGARAYTLGEDVALGVGTDLHTVAHEAAHVVQQRAGVHLPGDKGQAGDVHERHADAVADRVVAGRSAQDLLDRYQPSGAAASGLMQQKPAPGAGATLQLKLVQDGVDPTKIYADEEGAPQQRYTWVKEHGALDRLDDGIVKATKPAAPAPAPAVAAPLVAAPAPPTVHYYDTQAVQWLADGAGAKAYTDWWKAKTDLVASVGTARGGLQGIVARPASNNVSGAQAAAQLPNLTLIENATAKTTEQLSKANTKLQEQFHKIYKPYFVKRVDDLDKKEAIDAAPDKQTLLKALAKEYQDLLTDVAGKANYYGFALKDELDPVEVKAKRIEVLRDIEVAGWVQQANNELYMHSNPPDGRAFVTDAVITTRIKAGDVGRTSPNPAHKGILHQHVNSQNENIIYSWAGAKMYVHGAVNFHMDNNMSKGQKNLADSIHDRVPGGFPEYFWDKGPGSYRKASDIFKW